MSPAWGFSVDSSPSYRYQLIDHTADAGVIAYGSDLPEAFASAARAMFEIVADLRHVGEGTCREVELSAGDIEALLVEWLSELLFLFDAERLLLSRFDVHSLRDLRLRATVYGEEIDLKRHRLKTGIKAITYHQLQVECDGAGCRARVIFDL